MVSKTFAMFLLIEVNRLDFLARDDNGWCHDFTVAWLTHMSSLSNNTLQKMLSLITVMFQKHKKVPYDKVCDHSLASSMNAFVSYIWVWTRLFIPASEMFGLQVMPVSTMHLFSLIKACAQHALSFTVDTHRGHDHCFSSASVLPLLKTLNHTHSHFWNFTHASYTSATWQ
jgi:hypothetical protein